MTYPSKIDSKKCVETTDGTVHTIPAFAGAQVGDTYFALFCGKKIPNANWGVTQQPGFPIWSTTNYSHSGSVNDNLGLLWLYGIVEAGFETEPIKVTTTASMVVAGVSVLCRGGVDQREEFILPNGALGPAINITNNPSMQVNPGVDTPGQQDRVPFRDVNGGNQGDAKFIAGFGRVGRNSFVTNINDPIGNGSSDGAPYWAERERDMNWVGGGVAPDGGNTTPFAVIDHAESTDSAGWKVQVALAHRDIPASGWTGHGGWTPSIYGGQVGITYWPIGADNLSTVPTALMGMRLHV